MTHICVGNLTIIGSDNGLSPGRRQAIIWTNAGILLIGPLGTNFSEILSEIITFSFKKMYLKVSSAKWRPFCLGLNVLKKPFSGHLATWWSQTHSVKAIPGLTYRWYPCRVFWYSLWSIIDTTWWIAMVTSLPKAAPTSTSHTWKYYNV